MTHDQLAGKYARLRTELADAYAEPVWSTCRTGHIDRIAAELIETERALAAGTRPRHAGGSQAGNPAAKRH